MPYKFNPLLSTGLDYYQSATIGQPIAGGTPNEFLYIDSSGKLAQSSSGYFDGTSLGIGSSILGSPRGVFDVNGSITVGTPNSPFGFIQWESPSGPGSQWNIFADGENLEVNIYAYDATHTIYSATPLDLNFTDNGDSSNYFWQIQWNPVVGAAGYLIYVVNDSWFGLNGLSLDVGNTVSSNYGDGTENSYNGTYIPPFLTTGGPSVYVDSSSGNMISANGYKGTTIDSPYFTSTAPAVGNVGTGSMTFDTGTPTMGQYNYFALKLDGQFSFLSFQKDPNGTDGQRLMQFVNYSNTVEYGSLDYNSSNQFVFNMRSGTTYGIAYGSADSGANLVWQIAATTGAITQKGKITTYNNIATDGLGVTAIYKAGRLAAQTAAQTLATYTAPASDGSYEVSANINVTIATAHSFTVTCTYTDETNVSRVLTMGFTQLSGATFLTAITNVTGTGPYESPVYHIRVKASTTITVATTGTFTTVTYNGESIIKQCA